MIDYNSDDNSNEAENKALPFINTQPLNSEKNFLSVFKQIAGQFFKSWQPAPKTDIKLTGRIQGLQSTAEEVLTELKAIKSDLEASDPDLHSSIEAVVNPIIREVQRIQRISKDPQTIAEQIDTAKRYSEWIERAQPWVHFLSAHLDDRNAIIQAVVKHTIHTSEELINKDIQVIRDYQQHKLAEMSRDNGERAELKHRLNQALNQSIHNLETLKSDSPESPEAISLEELEAWKKNIDVLREKYYNQSLHVVDDIFHEVHPIIESEEQHDQVIENVRRMASLEQSVMDFDVEKSSLEIFRTLHIETNSLEQTLGLTPMEIERLNMIKMALEDISQQLKKKINDL